MISSKPRISVITTIYNCQDYLRAAIESILAQTFTDFEFIIINDGSTDRCDDVVNSFKDSRIRYIRSLENKKIPTRRNEAINLAQGLYVAIQDGDDISLPDRLRIQYQVLANNLSYFCVGSYATRINPEGVVMDVMDYPPEKHADIIDMIIKQNKNPMIDPTTMFRRADFLELGGYTLEKEIYTVPDFDLWLRAILRGKLFCNMQEPLIKYRVNPNGMTNSRQTEMIRAHMTVWHRFMSERFKLNSSKK